MESGELRKRHSAKSEEGVVETDTNNNNNNKNNNNNNNKNETDANVNNTDTETKTENQVIINKSNLVHRNSKSELSDPPAQESDLECPICMSIFRNATDLSCGHSFCGECIIRQIHDLPPNSKKCPICRAVISSIHPSYALRRVVDAYKIANPERAALLEREQAVDNNSSTSLPDLDMQLANEILAQNSDIYSHIDHNSQPPSGSNNNTDSILATVLIFTLFHLWDPFGVYKLDIGWLMILLDWLDEVLIIFWIGFFVMRALASFDVPLR